MKILAVIPARSGSKSVPHKNIRLLNGKPMLCYSIDHARQSAYINRIILSTDSSEYAQIGQKAGAEVPFLRPAEYATDTATDYDVFYHLLTTLEQTEGYIPDVVVQLRPTYPIRNVKDLDAMISLLLQDESIDSVRSMAPAGEIPYKMWKRTGDGDLIAPILNDIPEAYNMPRQQLPRVYYQNACVDCFRPRVVTKLHSMSGEKILGYEMTQNYDIDTQQEFAAAEEAIRRKQERDALKSGGKRFVFDIDGVIAKLAPKNDYNLSEPNQPMIDAINRLYDWGNHIILFTARGYVSGIDWEEKTKQQLAAWGLHYHELYFGKPNADYYVDDKMIAMADLVALIGVER